MLYNSKQHPGTFFLDSGGAMFENLVSIEKINSRDEVLPIAKGIIEIHWVLDR
jgi:hypothetical protein